MTSWLRNLPCAAVSSILRWKKRRKEEGEKKEALENHWRDCTGDSPPALYNLGSVSVTASSPVPLPSLAQRARVNATNAPSHRGPDPDRSGISRIHGTGKPSNVHFYHPTRPAKPPKGRGGATPETSSRFGPDGNFHEPRPFPPFVSPSHPTSHTETRFRPVRLEGIFWKRREGEWGDAIMFRAYLFKRGKNPNGRGEGRRWGCYPHAFST